MLRLSAAQIAQIARIDERELQDFVAHLTEGARRIVPDDVAHLSDDDLHRSVDVATRQALRSGLETQRDVMLYVLATLWLEPDFPQNMPDLYEILANPGIPYDERRHWLAEARVDRQIEEMGE